jgi:hypothetical protein
MIASLAIAASLASFMPPAQFDYEPRQAYTVTEFSAPMLKIVCRSGQYAGGRVPYACTYRSLNAIFILNTLTGANRDIILRHEKAHLNGWNHD